MLFERLLFSCLIPGKTKFEENDIGVEIKPQPEKETVLFFCIDKNSEGKSSCSACGGCSLRSHLWGKDQKGKRICDLLVFYANSEQKSRVLCFVELKDNRKDLGKATSQVISAYRAMKNELKLSNNYLIKAFLIGDDGASPREHREYQDQLSKEFKDNYWIDAKRTDFADFLGGTLKKPSTHGRKRQKGRK